MDSNHRSETQQIYSLPPLATREPLQIIGAGDGTRTRNLLITNQLLCQLSYTSLQFHGRSHDQRVLLYHKIICLSTLFYKKFNFFILKYPSPEE